MPLAALVAHNLNVAAPETVSFGRTRPRLAPPPVRTRSVATVDLDGFTRPRTPTVTRSVATLNLAAITETRTRTRYKANVALAASTDRLFATHSAGRISLAGHTAHTLFDAHEDDVWLAVDLPELS